MLSFIQDKLAHLCGLYSYIHQMQRAHDSVCTDLNKQIKTNTELRHHLEEVQANAKRLYECNKELRNIEASRDQWNEGYNKIAGRCTELEELLEEEQRKVENLEAEKKHLFDLYDTANTKLADMAASHDADMRELRDYNRDLRRKVSEANGKLSAYVRKYGEMNPKREKERQRKANRSNNPNPTNETTPNPTTD